jgi:parallel beta-helix repeat protein
MIKNNYSHDNGATGIQIEDGSENIVVENNRCDYNAQTHEYETGIWVDSSKNVIVSGNSMRGNNIGLMVTDSSHIILRRNVVVENNRGVPHLRNAMGLNINRNTFNVAVVHNTLSRNGALESQRGGISICAKPPVGGIVFKNNIFSGGKAPHDLWIGCKDYVSDYNLVYNTRGLVVYWLTDKVSWSQYLASSGQDVHSLIEKEPKFTFPEEYNFYLQPGSPAIDAGDFLTRTLDSGKGNIIQVLDASFFTNGFGVTSGDLVQVGENRPVTVTHVDYTKKTITVDENISWKKGDGVSYPYSGPTPDMGAFEYARKER